MSEADRQKQAERDKIKFEAAVSIASGLMGGKRNKLAEQLAEQVERDERREAGK